MNSIYMELFLLIADIRTIVNNETLLEKYEDFMLRRVLAADPDSRWCDTSGVPLPTRTLLRWLPVAPAVPASSVNEPVADLLSATTARYLICT
jgi:hypothetical protein